MRKFAVFKSYLLGIIIHIILYQEFFVCDFLIIYAICEKVGNFLIIIKNTKIGYHSSSTFINQKVAICYAVAAVAVSTKS